MRHSGDHFLVDRHLFLYGPLHSNQADAELVFQQLAHRTDTAVSEMVDVVDLPDILAKFEQVFDDSIEVRRLEDPLVKRRCQVQLDIEFQASDSREVILACVEEHTFEQRSSRLQCRRIARTQFAVDLDQRFLAQSLTQNDADIIALGKENRQFRHPGIDDGPDDVLGQFVIGLDDHLTRVRIHDVANRKCAFEILRINFETLNLSLLDVVVYGGCDFFAGVNENFLRLWVGDVLRDLQSNDVIGNIPEDLLAFNRETIGLIEGSDDFLIALQTKSTQENRGKKLSLAIDPDVKDVLGRLIFELYP